MKRVHRKMNDLLRQQLIVQEQRIKDCGFESYLHYHIDWVNDEEDRDAGSFYSQRFKTKTL